MYDRDRPVLSDDNKHVSVNDLYHLEHSLNTDNSFSEWLTNGEWNEEKYSQYLLLKATPVVSNYIQFLEDYHDDMSYMRRNQLTWDDVQRPWKLKSSNSGASFIRSGFNFISSNVKRLYR